MIYLDNREFKKEIEYEIYILKKYLTKHYDSNKADYLIKNNLSNLDRVAKALGKQDIAFFCLYFLRDLFVPQDNNNSRALSSTHYEVLEELNNMFVVDKTNREEFILPRGFGKSTVINTALSVWASCYKISKYTCVIGKTEELVNQFVDECKSCFKFKKVIDSFGDLVQPRKRIVNKMELELDNDTKIQGYTWGGTIRGAKYNNSRPTVIITDDVLKEDDILSDGAKEKCVNKYYKEVLPAGDKARVINGKKQGIDTKFIVIGTPLAGDDFINTIREDSSFNVFKRSVCNLDVDEYFTTNKYWLKYKEILLNNKNENRVNDAENYFYDHIEKMRFETLWEGKYKCHELANDYFTKRLAFMQELMCDCDKVGDIWIKYMAKMTSKEIEEHSFQKTVLSIDQGASNTNKSDFSAFTVLSKSNGFYYVREGTLKKFDSKTEFDKYIDFVIILLKKWKDITHIFLEKNVYKGVDATRIEERIVEDIELKKRNIVVESTYSTKNKDSRIMTITDKINSGQVIFNEFDKEYNDQVFQFRGQKFVLHDDAIDSLEMAINNIDTIKTKRNKMRITDISKLF